jgi:hypothetical protein
MVFYNIVVILGSLEQQVATGKKKKEISNSGFIRKLEIKNVFFLYHSK